MAAKVLIVDDEKDFLDIMAERMDARGMKVSTTTSAETALKMVQKEAYDAVIMDLMMPEMDGFKALKLFKEARPEVAIILLTANVPQEKCIEAIKLGAMDVIEKPADLNLLTQKIEEAKAMKMKKPRLKNGVQEDATASPMTHSSSERPTSDHRER